MLYKIISLVFFSCFISLAQAQTQLSSQLDSLIATLPTGSEVGISVYDLTAKKSLYNYREDKLSRPASTMKLVTAITALALPKADEPFQTNVWYKGSIEKDTLWGDLYVIGGFDPEFSEEGMQTITDHVAQLPFSVIQGHIYGDISQKDSLYWGHGWAWDDSPSAFQPHMSPLMYHKGTVNIMVQPGRYPGDSAMVTCIPSSNYFTIENTARTSMPSAGRARLTRDWLNQSNRIIVSGNVIYPFSAQLNVHSSERYFMQVFTEQLARKGVTCQSAYGFNQFEPDSTSVLVAQWNTSIRKVLNEMMKESDNLNAEAMLWRIGKQTATHHKIIAKDGLNQIKKLIERIGHNPKDYHLVDGCGLSNYDYVSPKLLVDLLTFAYNETEVFQHLYKALPVAGIDGTLKHRMKKTNAYRKVHAKTGSYTAINSLAGYLQTQDNHWIAFAIMNQNILSGKAARNFQDQICSALCGYTSAVN